MSVLSITLTILSGLVFLLAVAWEPIIDGLGFGAPVVIDSTATGSGRPVGASGVACPLGYTADSINPNQPLPPGHEQYIRESPTPASPASAAKPAVPPPPPPPPKTTPAAAGKAAADSVKRPSIPATLGTEPESDQ